MFFFLSDHGYPARRKALKLCCRAAVLGVMTLNPEATSMLSLFWMAVQCGGAAH